MNKIQKQINNILKNMSVKDLAKLLSVTEKTVYNMKQQNPSITTIQKLITELKLDPRDFFEFDESIIPVVEFKKETYKGNDIFTCNLNGEETSSQNLFFVIGWAIMANKKELKKSIIIKEKK